MRSDVGRAVLALALGLVPLSLAAGTPQADLRVAITDNQTRAVPGQGVTYQIEVYNAGPDPAPASTVSTELVPSLVPVGWTCTGFGGAVCAAPSGSGALTTTVDLPTGGLAIFTMTGTVTAAATGLLPTRATSFPPAGVDDPDLSSNTPADTDNLTLDVAQLVHGFDETRALTADMDFFWITQQPFASYEVVVDATSGDIGAGSGPSLERMANDSTLTLQTSVPVGTGASRSLRWRGPVTGAVVSDQFVRVRSLGCVGCGLDDVYRIRAYDTTYTIPRFNNSGTQVTLLFLQNPTTETATGTMVFWTATGGPVSTYGFNLPARQTLVLNTTTATMATSGSITIATDAPYAALAGKAVSVEPSTGFAFDTPLLPRPR
jgi:uncharacterized repeat protein (TIGR01451 family)